MIKQGCFIVFEGVDGSGKSSVVKRIGKILKENQIQSYVTKEPTDSPFGSLIHQFMIGRLNTDHKTIAAMFVADRIDHLTNNISGIKQIVDSGSVVISDRYYFSSYAYHSIFVDMEWVINANKICSDILKPDLNIFIDTSPKECIKRLDQGRYLKEKYEDIDYLESVRSNYLKAFERQKNVENIAVINGNKTLEEVVNDTWEEVKKVIFL